MTRYTPDSPQVAGFQWFPAGNNLQKLVGSPGRVAVVNSTVTEGVTNIDTYLKVSSPVAKVQYDIYDTSNVDRSPLDTLGYASPPVGDGDVHADWVKNNGSNVNLFQAVDNIQTGDMHATDPPSIGTLTADYMWIPGEQGSDTHFSQALFRCRSTFASRSTGATADPFTGRRVHVVRVRATCEALNNGLAGNENFWAHVMGALSIGGHRYLTDETILRLGDGFQELVWEWTLNPRTGFPWTNLDVQNFQGSDLFGCYARIVGVVAAFQLYNIQLEVVTVEDRRVALARKTVNGPLTAQWHDFPIVDKTTDGQGTWVKQAGKTYAVVAYLGATAADVQWQAVDPLSGRFTDHSAAYWPLLASGITGDISDPSTGSYAYSLVFRNSGSNSVDSQPYSGVVGAQVSATAPLRSEFTNAGTLAYGQVAVGAWPHGPIGGAPTATAPLRVSLRRVSDDALLAGPVDIDVTEFETVDGQFRKLEVRFPSAPTLAAGTQYALVAESATSTGRPWYLSVLVSDPTFENVTFGGTANRATYSLGNGAPSAEVVGSDAPFTVKTVPAVVTGIVVGQGVQATRLPLTGACAANGIGYATLTWTPSTLGGAFARYEIERHDIFPWQRVAHVTAETNAYFNDFELRRNFAVQYRIRVVRTDGAFSDWTTSNLVSVPAANTDLVLTSNLIPDLDLVYMSADPEREWQFPDGQQRTLTSIAGQHYQKLAMQYERMGDRFSRTMVVAFSDPAVLSGALTPGINLFRPLETLVHNPLLQHVCLCDGDGNRWFTSAVIQRATQKEWGSGHQYLATVEFTQVQGPAVVETSTPWAPEPVTTLVYGDPGGTYGDADSTYGTT